MIRGFQEMDFPESPHLSPHISGLLAVYTGYVRKIIKDNLLCITSGCISVSSGGIFVFWKFVSWTQRTFRKPIIENIDVGVWLYWCYVILKLHIFFLYTLFLETFLTLQFNRRYNFTLRRCRILCAECGTVWSGFGEGVCSRWLCGVCVCVWVCVSTLCCCE